MTALSVSSIFSSISCNKPRPFCEIITSAARLSLGQGVFSMRFLVSKRSSNRDTPLLALILVLGATIAIALVLTFAPAVS